MKWNSSCIAVFGATVLVSSAVHADDVVILATGRRDPRIYAIDLREALRPANNNTSNAIVSRSLVNPRRLDGTLLGDPANLVLSDDQRTAFVMNHHGGVTNREFLTRADGADARPKGTYVTPDGRFAVVTGGANTLPSPTPTGTVFIVDLAANRQVATVTGVGIDPYNLVVVDRAALGDGD